MVILDMAQLTNSFSAFGNTHGMGLERTSIILDNFVLLINYKIENKVCLPCFIYYT